MYFKQINFIKMKKINISFISFFAMVLACVTLLLISCMKEDDYKKFTKGGEISYTGKLDSIKIFSGNKRVVIQGLLIADPKVSKCVVYWNNKADSMVVPITRTQNIDTLRIELGNMVEGVHNFTIFTYDNLGNVSVPTYVSGRVYGDRYASTLSNRPINSAFTNESGLTSIDWGAMDRLSGVFATELTYTNASNDLVSIRIPIDSLKSVLSSFKEKTSIQYKTLFLPDTLSIDTFFTVTNSLYVPKFSQTDITTTYLKNSGPNVKYSSINSAGRWGILSDWISNTAVQNAGGFGGYEKRSNVGFISLEAGWGLPNVTNGKIYQTITLPARQYKFRISMNTFNTGGQRYLAVAKGSTLPNTAEVTSSSIAFANLESKELNFTLTQETTVSLGFVASITGTGGTGMFSKIESVSLFTVQYL